MLKNIKKVFAKKKAMRRAKRSARVAERRRKRDLGRKNTRNQFRNGFSGFGRRRKKCNAVKIVEHNYFAKKAHKNFRKRLKKQGVSLGKYFAEQDTKMAETLLSYAKAKSIRKNGKVTSKRSKIRKVFRVELIANRNSA